MQRFGGENAESQASLLSVLGVGHIFDRIIVLGDLACKDLVTLSLVSQEMARLVTDDAYCCVLRARYAGADALIRHARG